MKKFLGALLEIAGEILITGVFFLVGWGILSLFGVDIFSGDNIEYAVLIGSVIFIAVFVFIAVIANKFMKK